MNKWSKVVMVACMAVSLSACSGGEADGKASGEAETLTQEEMPGPKIGEQAPFALTAKTKDGEDVSIADLVGEKGIVLVFFRSAEWCPYCQAQLKGLSKIRADIEERGFRLAAVSYDDPAVLKKFADAQNIEYTLLSDEGSKIIDTYGIRDPQYTEGRAVGVPYASIFVMTPDGKVIGKTVSSDYKVRPSGAEVMALLNTAA